MIDLLLILIVAGLGLLMVGGKLIVDSAVKVAQLFGISERVIGLTIVAAGTSLPELATSIIATQKKNYDIAIGNIVGFNIFNVLFIWGVSAVISPIPVAPNAIFDMLFNILISVMLLVAVLAGKKQKIIRMAGIVFLITYILYTGYLQI